MNGLDRINAALAQPMTHRVVTAYDDGTVKHHDTRGMPQAENWATGERRKVGRKMVDRATGATVSVVSVEICAL